MKNKKLFAILTLVCFMFTLMPVAAFAADQVLVNGVAEADDVEVGTPFEVALQSGAEGYAFYAVDADNKGVAITTGSSLKIKVAGDYQVFAVPTAYGVDQLVKNANDITHNETPATAVAKIQGAFDDTIVKAYATVTVVAKEAKYEIALAEAFGATVAYDEATQAVTAELNGVTVVMTIGSAEYTVNGVAKTADVAPFINGSRTMVPVRFAAEAFGIKVIPTYDENGATADILFNL